jgi:AcrR family transcriptional regulator
LLIVQRGQNRQTEVRARMSDSPDERALRTRQALVSAYRGLVSSHAVTDVSVARVVQRAGVTRSSFYAHFANTDDLAVAALTEVFDVVASADSASRRQGTEPLAEVSEQSLAEVVAFIADRRVVYRDLLARADHFALAVEDAFAERSLATLAAAGHSVADPVVTARFIAAGVMGVIAWWLREASDWTAEELAHHLAAVIPTDFTRD